jgi:antirestriction protein ArdC
MKTAEIHEMVTKRMVEALEAGTVPWHKPWKTGIGGRPVSMSTGKPYRGINTWLLSLTAMDGGYSSPWWGTFHKIKELGGHVRKGEHHTKVVWWKTIVKPDPDDPAETITYMVGKTDQVFSACQCDGLPDEYYPGRAELPEVPELPEPQSVLDSYIVRGPALRHALQNRAYYQSGPDMITLPERGQFDSADEYYSTAFHECGHSTGHPSRLDREGIATFDHFGSARYGREELCAEMTAAMLCAMTGIDATFGNSASYVASWLKSIQGDIRLVSSAAAHAQAAVDLVMGAEAENGELDRRPALAA